jgi:hypothetical protein
MADPQPDILARIADYSSLLQVIRQRVDELGVTHETLDAISGLQTGYSSKLLCDPPLRRMGPLTLFIVLPSLGMSVALAVDPLAMKALETRMVRRRTPRLLRARSITLTRDFYSHIARLGNAARMVKLTPARRRAIARKAIRARWARVREAAIAP